MKKEKSNIFSYLYILTAVFHIFYAVVFCIEKSGILAGMNGIFILAYLCFAFGIKKASAPKGIYIACTTIMLIFLISHYIYLGPTFGFQYLSLAAIPIIYFLTYVNGKKVKFSIIASAISFAIFVIVSIVCSFITYPMIEVSEISRRIVVSFNAVVSFFTIIFFLTSFVNQITEDAGELELKNSDLEHSANVDTLTGLRNRRTIETYITKAFQMARGQGSDFSFLMCDIDNFKKVNDTYGHDCGDQVLKNVAGIIQKEIRPEDIAFRWGGEEILIIVHAKGHIAKKVAERCRKAIESSSVLYDGKDIKVTITIGGSTYYQGATRDDLINRADDNLYTGKNNGKNQVVM